MLNLLKKLSLFMLFVAVLLWVISPALAQDTTTTIVLPNGTPPVDSILESLVTLIYNATFLPFAAGMVVVATALTKRLPFLKSVSSSILSLWWTVILWAIWVIATQIGLGGQFENVITGLTTIGAAMLGITITPMIAGKLYEQAKAQNVAVIGYSRGVRAVRPQYTKTPPEPIAEVAANG